MKLNGASDKVDICTHLCDAAHKLGFDHHIVIVCFAKRRLLGCPDQVVGCPFDCVARCLEGDRSSNTKRLHELEGLQLEGLCSSQQGAAVSHLSRPLVGHVGRQWQLYRQAERHHLRRLPQAPAILPSSSHPT